MIARPDHLSASGWNAIARNGVRGARLQQDIAAKYLIIGAGYAGLAAARRLAALQPQETIVVLDALSPAENASGRNSGFMIDLPYAKIDARCPAGQETWQIALLQSGRRLLKDLVEAHRIECGWREGGHYKAAATAHGANALKAVEATLEQNRVPFRRLAAAQIKDELGSSFYRNAIWLPSCTLVQPAELVNGLIRSLPENVKVFFDSPVRTLSNHNPYTALVNGHQVRAEYVLLCVNTGLPQFGCAKYRQLTMFTYACLSRELDNTEASAFGSPQDWGVTPVERLQATSRKIAGRRIMLRAAYSYKHEMSHDLVRRHLSQMLSARYPDMPRNFIEHVWGGAVSITRNGAPICARYREKLYGVSGCNGSGILKMTMLGTLLVDSMLGIDSELLSRTHHFSRPNFIPPDPVRRMAVNLNIRKLRRIELGGKS